MSLTRCKISARNSVGVFSWYATSSFRHLRTVIACLTWSAARASFSTVTVSSSSLFASRIASFSASICSFFRSISSSMRSTVFFSDMTCASCLTLSSAFCCVASSFADCSLSSASMPATRASVSALRLANSSGVSAS